MVITAFFSSHKFICLISYQHYSLSCGREVGKQRNEPENKKKMNQKGITGFLHQILYYCPSHKQKRKIIWMG